jgi:hypothetical protein
MGRRRVKEKHIPMSLSMPYRLIIRVDSELSHKQSRSKWVQGAIKAKLEDESIINLNSYDLLMELQGRKIIDSTELKLFISRLRSVETEE